MMSGPGPPAPHPPWWTHDPDLHLDPGHLGPPGPCGTRRTAVRGDQGLRPRPRRARHRPLARARRDRRLPRPQRRRQDHDHRHGARPVAAHHRLGPRARPPAASGHLPRPRLRRHADRRTAQGPLGPRDRHLHGQPVRRHGPGRRGAAYGGHRRRSPTGGSASARAASSSGSGSRWHCCPTPRCCCSTSPPRAWTSRDGAPSGPRSARTPRRAAPCSSRPTTSRRPTSTPTGSS